VVEKKEDAATLPFDAIGKDLAKLMDIKRRLIELGKR
jgi:hypothetical protein